FDCDWSSDVCSSDLAWGSDSSTNNIKTEVFYPDTISFQDNLRVHVIPPFDGIYVMWDYRAGKVATYYNPWQSQGAPIDGQNDEEIGRASCRERAQRG